jgi:uncharacterized membrane protein YphA (DoxX/SURF4 family)
MNVSANVPRKRRTISIWVLRVVLGLVFLYVGTTKLTGTGHTVEYFAAIGWGQWFRYLTGFLDIVGVALLFVPQLTCVGATVLACSVGTATLISVTVLRGDPTWGSGSPEFMVVFPLVLTLVAALLAWLTRPHRVNFLETACGTDAATPD